MDRLADFVVLAATARVTITAEAAHTADMTSWPRMLGTRFAAIGAEVSDPISTA